MVTNLNVFGLTVLAFQNHLLFILLTCWSFHTKHVTILASAAKAFKYTSKLQQKLSTSAEFDSSASTL